MNCAASRTNCGAFLAELETRERTRTGITTLKVEYNRVHGFYIEVTRAQSDKVPDDYRRRQTLKNAERYITPELKTFEDKALSAQERALAREKLLYEQLLRQLAPQVPVLQQVAAALAELDMLAAFAERATALKLGGAGIHRRSGDRHRRRSPSGGRGAGHAVHRQQHAVVGDAAHAADHRPQYGRQIDLYAADRADRPARPLRLICPGNPRAAWADRPHLHAHRCRR